MAKKAMTFSQYLRSTVPASGKLVEVTKFFRRTGSSLGGSHRQTAKRNGYVVLVETNPRGTVKVYAYAEQSVSGAPVQTEGEETMSDVEFSQG